MMIMMMMMKTSTWISGIKMIYVLTARFYCEMLINDKEKQAITS